MLIGVCDFPGDYLFPPKGYGGIERWLWATAVGGRRAGAQVHLLGPLWRRELSDDWTVRPFRLEDLAKDDACARDLRATGYDLLVVGHEYPSVDAWRATWEMLDADVATFQHEPHFRHGPNSFDGRKSRLYCYSPEMCRRYAQHHPIAERAVHMGIGEIEHKAHEGRDLLWLGRIDAQKAPHHAIRAARLLGRRIVVAGPTFDPTYVNAHHELFCSDGVDMVGEVGGGDKMRLLADARVLVYSCAREYVEAGAATFGESLRAGTPVAALAWRPGTCAHVALCRQTGCVAEVGAMDDDAVVAESLAVAIEHATTLRASEVQEIGMHRFDPMHHFQVLSSRPC